MAQRVEVQLLDDLNGEEAQETVRFGIDGHKYEIDLTIQHATQLRDALSPYVHKARKPISRNAALSTGASLSMTRKREELQRIREWAKGNGHNPSSRGRISQTALDAYVVAQNTSGKGN
ncbi:Lsr2 family protein [Arthrobacter flavus]|uniref:Lsr2 family protein n=1 Tax=Arthrobacter flavus TaxID=95172 RepID=A0ABW4Q986_9MICC